MHQFLFDGVRASAERSPDALSVSGRRQNISYESFVRRMERFACGLVELGAERLDRVAVYLPNLPETAVAMFGTACAGCVFVPISPALLPRQVEHILQDCGVRVLITSAASSAALQGVIHKSASLRSLVLVGEVRAGVDIQNVSVHRWDHVIDASDTRRTHRVIDIDPVSIFYTSGSTGKPKGVVLSHRNMVAGAAAVAEYLGNKPSDRLLGVLPLSFDYGFSQLSTAFLVAAQVVLMDYLLPGEIIAEVAAHRITGLAGVPPLWNQLADLAWPVAAQNSMRYITNSGGSMPLATLRKLRARLPKTEPVLMYGLTEAFRSTFLPPCEVDRRPTSIGKAIPNAEILVVREDGTRCAPNEPGELVHRGASVAMGYWNDPIETAKRFRPLSESLKPGPVGEGIVVWSGDTVRMDEEGFLYFLARRDEMIKTSCYRVSPTEVEEVVFATGLVTEAAAVGVPHPGLGQAIVVVATAAPATTPDSDQVLGVCRQQLPSFMVPIAIEWRESLPRNSNGKYDRAKLASELCTLYADPKAIT